MFDAGWNSTRITVWGVKLSDIARREFGFENFDILAKAFNCRAAFVQHKLICSLKKSFVINSNTKYFDTSCDVI